MKAIILAGGSGTRLLPVTLEIPKPLLTVRRKPILNYLIEFFAKHGVTDTTVVIHKDHAEDYEWWKKRYRKELPKRLNIFAEPKPLGTFGGMKYLKPKLNAPFILSNGDELKDFDLTDFIRAHRENPAHPVATIALVKVPNPSQYGVPVMSDTRITEFLEKPANPPSSYVSSGIYILDPEVFQYADFKKGFLMIEKDVFPRLAAAGKLAGYKIKNGRWFDCGTLPRWEKAIREW
ncbi:MAG: nucleotidyltransferase family protein [bacterium]|nr:nucleotidyltransferase family protein [bacterium]